MRKQTEKEEERSLSEQTEEEMAGRISQYKQFASATFSSPASKLICTVLLITSSTNPINGQVAAGWSYNTGNQWTELRSDKWSSDGQLHQQFVFPGSLASPPDWSSGIILVATTGEAAAVLSTDWMCCLKHVVVNIFLSLASHKVFLWTPRTSKRVGSPVLYVSTWRNSQNSPENNGDINMWILKLRPYIL